jgi:hypothetical protein
MSHQLFQPLALSDLFAKVSSTGKMTLLDRFTIRDTLLTDQPSNEEKQAIDRLIHAIRVGRIQILN